MTKIEKINDEIGKIKAKIAEQQGKLRDMERQKKDAENIEIVAAIRSGKINERELAAMVRRFAQNNKPIDTPTEAKFKHEQEESKQ